MYVEKNFGFKALMRFTGWHLQYITAWTVFVVVIHEVTHWSWFHIPWLPVSVIGTAVAFYVGFKNNQAYDRLWEARKIWGAMVNSSRAWGSVVKAYISDQFTEDEVKKSDLDEIKKRLIYRHIAWLYALRSQLLLPTPWEHISQSNREGRIAEARMKTYGVGLLADSVTKIELDQYLPPCEKEELINYKNTATQIIDRQSQDLAELRRNDIIEDFRHMEMQNILNDFYIHQGKAERIKKFPLPRQYGFASLLFVRIFIFILPLAMVSEFHELGTMGTIISIPFTIMISWIFILMELVGDYSENPFEGMGNDIPMLSLCRVIEIDLREMLGETELPPPIEPVDGVLM